MHDTIKVLGVMKELLIGNSLAFIAKRYCLTNADVDYINTRYIGDKEFNSGEPITGDVFYSK
jgi:hypothetical protein